MNNCGEEDEFSENLYLDLIQFSSQAAFLSWHIHYAMRNETSLFHACSVIFGSKLMHLIPVSIFDDLGVSLKLVPHNATTVVYKI